MFSIFYTFYELNSSLISQYPTHFPLCIKLEAKILSQNLLPKQYKEVGAGGALDSRGPQREGLSNILSNGLSNILSNILSNNLSNISKEHFKGMVSRIFYPRVSRIFQKNISKEESLIVLEY